jgi:Ala-tRNA(Pro) deacylase
MEAFDRIVEHLERHAARFRVLRHAAEGRSIDVAAVRGTEIAQGAKALVCRVKGTESGALLAVVPGDARLDIRRAVAAVGGRKGGFAPAELARELTGCEIGTIPPFAIGAPMDVVVDEGFVAAHEEIAFNAGRLDRSIVLATADYLRIVAPVVAPIAAVPEPEPASESESASEA